MREKWARVEKRPRLVILPRAYVRQLEAATKKRHAEEFPRLGEFFSPS